MEHKTLQRCHVRPVPLLFAVGCLLSISFYFNSCRIMEKDPYEVKGAGNSPECKELDPTLTTSYYAMKQSLELNQRTYNTKEDFLKVLPEDLRRNVLLFYSTGSPDNATYDEPRVLFFDSLANPRFMMAVDGSPEHRRFEIIEFMESSRRFCFHEIALGDNGVLKYTDHPASCVGCHKSDMRPNWEAYNMWPDVYGSRDGAMKVDSAEGKGYKDFITRSRDQGVYKTIVGPKDLSVDVGDGFMRFFNENSERTRSPQAILTSGLVKKNNLRIARMLNEIVSVPAYAPYKFALLAGIIGCPSIESFLPQSLLENHPRSYTEILADTKSSINFGYHSNDSRIANVNTAKDQRLAAGQPESEIETYTVAVANMRYLLENRRNGGISILNWSMSRSGSYLFSADDVGLTDAGYWFQKDVLGATDGPLADPKFYNQYSYDDEHMTKTRLNVCKDLKEKSLQHVVERPIQHF